MTLKIQHGQIFTFMSIKNKFKAILHPFEAIKGSVNTGVDNIKTLMQTDYFKKLSHDLTNQTLRSKESGITSEKICPEDVVVSLTSYGRRIYDVYLAIESIMQGSLKPNRIILWLSEDEFKRNTLPITLQNQIKRGLEIYYCKDIRSFKKLIYTLKECPDATIVTIDDDVIYNFDFLENLVKSHSENPSYLYANRVHRIKKNRDGSLKNYLNWEYCVSANSSDVNDLFFTGIGGVLYPPYSLHKEVFNEDVFAKICPTADDVWFNAMVRLKGTQICKSFTHSPNGEDFTVNEALQYDGLWAINNNPNDCQNDKQIKAVFEKYGINNFDVKQVKRE